MNHLHAILERAQIQPPHLYPSPSREDLASLQFQQTPREEVLKPSELFNLDLSQEDWLSRYSLIDAYDLGKVGELGVSDGALKYICLGSSSHKINEAGWHDRFAHPYFLKLFQLFQGNGGLFTKECFYSEIFPICEQLVSFWKRFEQLDLETFASEISLSIIHLKPGDSYVMGAGYAGHPTGHSIIIRFKKSEDGNRYTIYLYDAGVSGEWGKLKVVNHKEYVHPYLQFEKVKNEELFFTSDPFKEYDPAIIVNLLKLLQPTERGDLSFHSVMSLLTPIRHRFVPGKRLSQLFITRQRGPNCVAKAFNCLLLDLIPDRNQYKRLTLDNRFHTILFYFLTHQDHLQQDQMASFRLMQATMNFLRSIYSHYRRGTLELEEYYQAVATIRDIVKTLPISSKRLQKANLLPSLNEDRLRERALYSRKIRSDELRKSVPSLLPRSLSSSPLENIDLRLGKEVDWKMLNGIIGDLLRKKWDGKALVFQIEFLMQNVRHLKGILPTLDKFEANLALRRMRLLAILYVKSLCQLNMHQSCASQNAIMEILSIGYCLALKSDEDKSLLNRFGIYYNYFERQASLFLFAIQDPLQLEHRNELITFFSNLPSRWQLFNYENENYNRELFCRGEMPESQLFQLYIPNISQKKRMEYFLDIEKFGSKFSHIGDLASLAGLATSLLKSHSHSHSKFYSNPIRDLLSQGLIMYTCGAFYWLNGINDEDFVQEYADLPLANNKERKLPPCFAAFSKSGLWKHDPKELLTENQWQGMSAQYTEMTKRVIFAPLCEPKVGISVFLKTWTEQIEILTDPEWRPLFENLLFKTYLQRKLTYSPLFLAIQGDPYFTVRIEKLTREGFRTVKNLAIGLTSSHAVEVVDIQLDEVKPITHITEGDKSCVGLPLDEVKPIAKHLPFREGHLQAFLGFLSVIRVRSSLLYHVRVIKKEDHLPDEVLGQREDLLNWINRFSLSSMSTGELKLELLLAKTLLLMEQSLKEMTTKERVDLAITYCTLQPNLGEAQKGESPVLRREIQRRWLMMDLDWMNFLKGILMPMNFF